MTRTLIILALACALAPAAFAQQHASLTRTTSDAARGTSDAAATSISGYVTDAETGETLIGANVQIRERSIGAVTNKSGYYTIANVPDGRHLVTVSFIGYKKYETTVTVERRRSVRVDIKLLPEAVSLGEVVVEQRREDDTREIVVGRINIPAAQIQQIRVGGEADVFRAIQYLPGVLASSQISSGLYIRGGSPDQTLVLLDGSTVYNPTHLFGFFSTFNPDAVKDVDLIKGGYPAEYGGRLSAVLDLTQKDGNANRFGGTGSLGLISSRLSLEGPIGNGSWFVGGRRTYIDAITPIFETPEDPLPDYYFYDLNAKISQRFGDADRVSISAFRSADEMAFDNNAGFRGTIGINNTSSSGRWTHLFSEDVFSVFTLSWSRYENAFANDAAGFAVRVSNSIEDWTLKGNVEWLPTTDLTLKTGIEVNAYTFEFKQNFTGNADANDGRRSGGGLLNLRTDDVIGSGFGQINWQLTERFSAQAGLRANYYQMRDLATWDPRFALRYQYDTDIALKAAWGVYHQYFHLAAIPDFSFFDTWLPTDETVEPGKSVQYVLGVETRPASDIDFNVELYYKRLSSLSELNQFATRGTTVRDYFYSGRGESYGIEFFAQKKMGRFTGWAGYALGYVNEQFDEINGGRWFRPKWDRRHDLKLVGAYKINDRWDVGATFTFQTGQSYTGMTSRTESRLPGDNVGRGVTVPADRYGLRLPPSHQLNLNVNYNTTLFGLPAKLLLDVFNVYSRRDIWFRFYDTQDDVTVVRDTRLLPILPSVALEVKF
jgi:outer membrane cobalamin receptor